MVEKFYSYSKKINDVLLFTWKWRPHSRPIGRFEKACIERGWAKYEDYYNPGYACEDFKGYQSGKKGPFHGGDYVHFRCLTLTDDGLEMLRTWNRSHEFDGRWGPDAKQTYSHRQNFVPGYSRELDQTVYLTDAERQNLSTVPGYEKLMDYDR